ncbi:ATP synthase mitochondrial F1 complex assembly factor 2 [Fonsecaea erecta]|uniref:ATP synthase mitochondrial F1 complex assembly factor 2 n=1 Tax=Fonsecaea erecta TaxID=1367422 RepID=A0A178ZWJ9_9EURO|nr:ATP synthase mitochondrial F1 complex assembly factor 2 [Fonsecaea erecta]OAP64062.1 ATP synthase mitochondrial F1 complex assembly factor 2 [Fonsecaea erecta]
MRTNMLRVSSSAVRCLKSHPSVGWLATPTLRGISSTSSLSATALPITATGPPPSAPVPTSPQYGDRIEERRRKAELLKQGKELRAATQPGAKTGSLKKRFWKEVHVKEVPEGYQVYLDKRPVRTPNKSILTVPRSKPHLAHAVAIEWDLLESAQQALKNHNIPMTSIVARAQDIIESEAQGDGKVRKEIIATMMRYLDTDTLLCWAPEHKPTSSLEMQAERTESLREIQIRTAKPILSYLSTSVWPGVEIKPVLGENSILPTQQDEMTRSVIRGWISGLPAYELAGLERAVLASKSLLVATRLLIEWSEEFRDMQHPGSEKRFGIEEAAEASSLEVRWQTGMWGEVEDSHDVENEDIRRQLGSVVLLVSGSR